jgi:hypothetical protein
MTLKDDNPNHNSFLEDRSNMMESTTMTPAPMEFYTNKALDPKRKKRYKCAELQNYSVF